MRHYLGHWLPETLEEVLRPDRTAVVVVDMQNDFAHPDGYCARHLGSEATEGFRQVVPTIAGLLEAARRSGVTCVFSRVVQAPDGSLASPVWLMDATRYSMEPLHCMAGTWGHEILDELAPRPGDVIVDKTRRSLFQGTPLESALRARGIDVLVMVGVAASGCVQSSVRDAIEKDFLVVVPLDAIRDGAPDLSDRCTETFQGLLDPQRTTTVAAVAGVWARRPGGLCVGAAAGPEGR